MQESYNKNVPDVLDTAQLTRIESVHRGFLYQHLYTVGCLLLAQEAEVESIMVELDEDIELVTEQGRIYVQVKTRSKPIIPSEISGALERFKDLRKEHDEGRRKGKASFVFVANQSPSIQLQKVINDKKLPPDVVFICPQSNSDKFSVLPPAWESLTDAVAWCISLAEKLNFSLLSPESLIWKLAGLAQLAATGNTAEKQHVFHTKDLPTLFEQLIVQLQDFPSPPVYYWPQKHEPPLISDERVRIICGLSGAGKTTWAAQSAQHCLQLCAYYDTGDIPGPALASTLVRELAAKFAKPNRDELRKIFLPGVSGFEALRAFDSFLGQQEATLILVLDNAHRIPVDNLRDILNATQNLRFVLLCQPHDNVRELEAIMGLQRKTLFGWDIDTVAKAVDELGGYATAQGYEQLRIYTGGLPLYVQSAAKVAISEYEGNVDTLCAELQQQENSVETPQEVILSRVYQGFEKLVQDSLALFSLADVGLSRDEVSELLVNSLKVSTKGAATILKKMRATGTVEIFGNQMLKVHDAVRALGLQHLELMETEVKNNALLALKELLVVSLHKNRDTSRFALLTQIYIKLNDIKTLIDLSGEELFYEMGINVDILASLERALTADTLKPLDKFWALDGIAFYEIKVGKPEKLIQRFEAMEALLVEHEFGYGEQTAYVMKRILFSAENGDAHEVKRLVEKFSTNIPNADHERIFDYNHAIALWRLKKYKKADSLCLKVIEGYYDLLGISSQDVIGKNSDVLWTVIDRPENVHEYLKHLADALELYATNREAWGRPTPFARIHSMKFYNMVGAGDSMVRVGQDLADQFVSMKDFTGAREVMEQHVLPVVNKVGLVGKLVQVRSQYAVILALDGQHEDAIAEMRRLEPYFEGLTGDQRQEFEEQSKYISHISDVGSRSTTKQLFGKVGRNEECPCGSGLKYKKCHGA
ncbi:SEC-C domain-containing protein [Shewanella sp. Isolate13]|uniref:SEC-C metal-binding domain-containing protein n=1 Tax=Shewanella sp. Isolate13 TaxID=2908531 RepID=UPI001EFDFCEF|nr:SEC-C metal-binding domain-containing protein [Shewanella sp. Isolate13]MCG9730055.1 SEC-C domain-containing protein [Shewanella sp. Isolate13]